jgi:hypothetical protein
VSKVVVKHSSLGVTDVEITRGLRGETSHNAVIGVEESNIVASTCLGLGGLGLLGGSVESLNSNRGPRAELLQEPVPTGQVDERALLQSSSSHTVTTESTPQSNVGGRESISGDEGAEEEVGVELLEKRIKSLEVESSQVVQLGDPLVLLDAKMRLDMYESKRVTYNGGVDEGMGNSQRWHPCPPGRGSECTAPE